MDDVNFYFFILIIISIFTVTFGIMGYIYYRRKSKVKKIFINQAQKRNGEVIFSSFSYPKLVFDYYSHKIKIHITPGGRYSPPCTYFTVKLSYNINNKLKVHVEGITSKIGKAFGSQDIEMGYPDFDNKYIIKSDDEYFARKIISQDIQDKLLLIEKYNPFLTIHDKIVKIYIPNLYLDEYFFEEVINILLKIVDKLK